MRATASCPVAGTAGRLPLHCCVHAAATPATLSCGSAAALTQAGTEGLCCVLAAGAAAWNVEGQLCSSAVWCCCRRARHASSRSSMRLRTLCMLLSRRFTSPCRWKIPIGCHQACCNRMPCCLLGRIRAVITCGPARSIVRSTALATVLESESEAHTVQSTVPIYRPNVQSQGLLTLLLYLIIQLGVHDGAPLSMQLLCSSWNLA